MTLAALSELVGSRVEPAGWPEAHGLVIGTVSACPPILRVRSDSDGQVRRVNAAALSLVPALQEATVPRRSPPPKPARAKSKSKLAQAKEGSDVELAAFLLGAITIPDRSWAERAKGETRQTGESREAFIRRVLLGEKAAA